METSLDGTQRNYWQLANGYSRYKKCMEVLGRISKFTFKVHVNIGDTGEEFTEE